MSIITRRKLFGLGALGMGGLVSGCDSLARSEGFMGVINSAEGATLRWQRLIGRNALAEEYSPDQLSPVFKANGTKSPTDTDYVRLAAGNFADWRLRVDGLVRQPLALSLDQLRAIPARAQITRHDCVEGWSAIGKWTGAPLGDFLRRIGADLTAKYVHFVCAEGYSVSIDMPTALHAQTQMTFKFDGETLPTRLGFPMRIRMPTKLGFKNPKHVVGLAVLNNYTGGYWEDRGYNWFSGL